MIFSDGSCIYINYALKLVLQYTLFLVCWLTWGVQFQSGEQQVRLRLFIQVSDVPDVTCSVTLSNDMVIELNL